MAMKRESTLRRTFELDLSTGFSLKSYLEYPSFESGVESYPSAVDTVGVF